MVLMLATVLFVMEVSHIAGVLGLWLRLAYNYKPIILELANLVLTELSCFRF